MLLVAALGLTLGAVICALSFAHLMVSKPLPYPEQERLVVAEQAIFGEGGSVNSTDYSYPALKLMHEAARDVFSASVMMDSARNVVLSHPAQPLVSINYVTYEYPQLFAPQMALGRFPSANVNADAGAAEQFAVISFAAWQSLFGMRSDVLGQRLRTATGDFEVVGVTASDFIEPEFNGPGYRTSVWLPWRFNPSPQHWGWAATTPTLTLAARLAPGVTKLQAGERLTVLLGAKWQEALGTSAGSYAGWSTRVELSPAQRAIAGDGRNVGLLMLAGTLGLVLVVLVNITHLLIARVAARAREFSIQLALGATRNQLFTLVLSDILLLMLPAGVAALLIAAAGFSIMQRYLFALLPRIEQLSVGIWTVALALSAVLVLAVLLAEIALRSCGRIYENDALNSGRSTTISKVSGRLRVALMASQVAVAGLVIAINLGLFKDAYQILNEPGIELERTASAFLYQSASASKGTASPEQQLTEIKRQLLELPGVEAVSQSHSPLQDFIQTAVVSGRSGVQFPVQLKRIDHIYFGITGQRLATGRNFSTEEIRQAANVGLINASFAKLLEKDGGALGTLLSRGGETPYAVIGVVDELAYAGTLASAPRIYLPASEAGSNFIIKFKPGYGLSREQLVAFLSGANPNFGVFLYDDLSQQRAEILLPRQITATAASIVALIVMLVSALGLYGMVSYTTRLRRAEIGARLAFGARARHIVLMLVRNNFAAVLIGSALSALFSWLVLPNFALWFDSHAIKVNWIDATFALGSLGLLVIIACYLSARPVVSQSQAAALRDGV